MNKEEEENMKIFIVIFAVVVCVAIAMMAIS